MRAQAAPWLALAVAVAVTAGGCAGDTFSTRQEARELALGRWHRDNLHCRRGECVDWYVVDLLREGELRVDVYSSGDPNLPAFALALEDDRQQVLERVPASGRSPRQIRREVPAGLYRIEIRADSDEDGLLPYEVLVDWRRPRRRSTPTAGSASPHTAGSASPHTVGSVAPLPPATR